MYEDPPVIPDIALLPPCAAENVIPSSTLVSQSTQFPPSTIPTEETEVASERPSEFQGYPADVAHRYERQLQSTGALSCPTVQRQQRNRSTTKRYIPEDGVWKSTGC